MRKQSNPIKAFLWISIAAAVVTIVLKCTAWWLTGSVGLLSDAMESFVNLAAAIIALVLIHIASRPEDEKHAFGHSKAEYFSSAIEGGLIILAAGSIAWSAIPKIINPVPLENVGIGLAVSMIASLINLVVAIVLIRNGKKRRSIALEADGKHLMTDVWTSVGVIAGILLVSLTDWLILDGIIALAVAANIIISGVILIKRSAQGLMDVSMSEEDLKTVNICLDAFINEGIAFHSLRTRQAGQRMFMSVHVLVPGAWTVQQGHDLLERIEACIHQSFDHPVSVFTHLEPIEDPASMDDIMLFRK